MGWLRRDKDCIALVAVWALLLQTALLSFVSGAHAATLASGQDIVLCTAKGAVIGRALPGQSPQKADCQHCAMSCRMACGGTCGGGGILPLALRAPLPASVTAPANPPRLLEPLTQSAEAVPAQPRAPPAPRA